VPLALPPHATHSLLAITLPDSTSFSPLLQVLRFGTHVDTFGYGFVSTLSRMSYVSSEQFAHPPPNLLAVYDPSLHTLCVGVDVGTAVGVAVGDIVGLAVGLEVGDAVGVAVGPLVGVVVGPAVGLEVGDAVGVALGVTVGPLVGVVVGPAVGLEVGIAVGGEVGLAVGAAVHSSPNAPELVCPAGQFAHWPSELPVHNCRVWLAKQPAHATHALSLDVVPGVRYVPLSHSVTVYSAQDK
jgi:hypothetical protein